MSKGMQSTTSFQHPDVGRVLGSYRILGLLGQGAMGLVFLAEHIYLGRKVALKKLKERYAVIPEAIENFFNEAQVVNQIGHPNIVEITDFVTQGETAYYIMELLEGHSLAQLLESQGPQPVRKTLYIAHQVADALAAVHEKGIVHADIKPSNIFLTPQHGGDFVKVFDFGLAQLQQTANPVNPAASRPTSSIPGMSLAGTPLYMAPEQADGTVSPQSDIYSLGVVCYHMLTGNTPFEAGSAPELMYKHMQVAPPRLSRLNGYRGRKIPTKCSRIVMRCLAKDPAERPQSADQLKHELKRAAASSGIGLETGSPPEMMESTKTPKFWAMISILGVLALLGIGAGGFFLLRDERPAQSSVAKKKSAPRNTRPRPVGKKDIRLTIKTKVSGAEVRRVKPNPSLLGVTPMTLILPRKNERWTLEISRSETEAKTLAVTLKESHTFVLELQPKKQKAQPQRTDGPEGKEKAPAAHVSRAADDRKKAFRKRRREARREPRPHRSKKDERGKIRARTDTVDPFAM
jgi:serine/threonine-protein kinase